MRFPVSQIKGLEYDRVVLVEPADIVAAEPRGMNRLYVAPDPRRRGAGHPAQQAAGRKNLQRDGR